MRSITLMSFALLTLGALPACSATQDGGKASSSSSTGAAGAGGGGGFELGVGGSTSGSGGSGGGASCVAVSLQKKHRPLDLYLMLDRSGSMQGAPWEMTKQALKQFFSAPPSDSLAAALNYFPNASVDTCLEEAFTLFAVDIGPLPGIADKLAGSLDVTNPEGGTPMGDALSGALKTATARKNAVPDHQVAVVLVTDGYPTVACHVPADALTTLAKEALLYNGTLTFAVGMGGASVPLLTSIADAGGTGKALSVTSPSALGDALTKAQIQAVGCEFVVPAAAPGGASIDPGLVNVAVTDATGKRSVAQVAAPGLCQNDEGWYYDNPAHPSVVRLCPASCDLLKAADAPNVDINFGCQTIIK